LALVFSLFFFGEPAFAETMDTFRATLRYHASRVQDNYLDETFYYQRQFKPWLDSEFGVRLAQNGRELLRAFDYKAELYAAPLSFLNFGARAAQRNLLQESTSSTQLLFTLNLHQHIFSGLKVFGTFGYFFRFPLLNKATIIPTFRSSFTERDVAFTFGVTAYPSENFNLSARFSTYDEMEVFNLQHPYFQLDGEYLLDGNAIALLAQFRYHVLLGFGRMDEWMFGVGIRLKLFKELLGAES
jgi:hypothetical protein